MLKEMRNVESTRKGKEADIVKMKSSRAEEYGLANSGKLFLSSDQGSCTTDDRLTLRPKRWARYLDMLR